MRRSRVRMRPAAPVKIFVYFSVKGVIYVVMKARTSSRPLQEADIKPTCRWYVMLGNRQVGRIG